MASHSVHCGASRSTTADALSPTELIVAILKAKGVMTVGGADPEVEDLSDTFQKYDYGVVGGAGRTPGAQGHGQEKPAHGPHGHPRRNDYFSRGDSLYSTLMLVSSPQRMTSG